MKIIQRLPWQTCLNYYTMYYKLYKVKNHLFHLDNSSIFFRWHIHNIFWLVWWYHGLRVCESLSQPGQFCKSGSCLSLSLALLAMVPVQSPSGIKLCWKVGYIPLHSGYSCWTSLSLQEEARLVLSFRSGHVVIWAIVSSHSGSYISYSSPSSSASDLSDDGRSSGGPTVLLICPCTCEPLLEVTGLWHSSYFHPLSVSHF